MTITGTDPLDGEGLCVAAPSTISTWTKRRVDPLNMKPEDIVIEDVAHALARLCRYNGHCEGFLSVARHSIWVSEHIDDPSLKLWGLLHDAAEAYIGDMVRPLKHAPEMQIFRDADERIEAVIAERFGLPFPMPQEVRDADNAVLMEMELPFDRDTYRGFYEVDERDFLRRYRLLTEGSCS